MALDLDHAPRNRGRSRRQVWKLFSLGVLEIDR